MTTDLHSMGAVGLGNVMLPGNNIGYSPSTSGQMYRHDDREYGSIQTITASTPAFSFQTPIKNAIDVIGFRVTKFTDIDIYLAHYENGIHTTLAQKYTLALSATAYAVITGFTVAQGGICFANVSVSLLSSDGSTDPLVPSTEAIPAIVEPLLHTLGPVTLNTVATDGVQSVDFALGQRWSPMFADGDLYPKIGSYDGGEPTISVNHADPVAVLGSAFTGAAITGTTQVVLNALDPTTQVPTATGAITISVADGRILPRNLSANVGSVAQLGFDIVGLSDAAQVHPWAIS